MASQVEGIKWVPGTRFLVDGFRFPSPACAAYFLTHAHSDHTTGLTSSWNSGPIYCSPITARILRHDFNLRPDCLRVLELDEPATICGVEVTPMCANHCPGAVMFLFKIPAAGGSAGAAGARQPACHPEPSGHMEHVTQGSPPPPCTTVLHTGDFRWHAGMAGHPALAGLRLDVLMLDTTYSQPKWVFPPQAEAVGLMAKLMAEEAAQHQDTLFVVGSYHIGKERAYLGAAHQLGWRVHCTPAKRKLLRLLALPPEWLALLTEDPEDAQIHVLGMGEQLHEQALADRIAGTRWSRVVAIKPTGWSFRPRGGLDRRDVGGGVVLLGVPYSEHSSWADLRECVAALRPRRIVPTVNATDPAKSRAIVDRFADLMDLSQDRSRLDCYFKRGAGKGAQASTMQAWGVQAGATQAPPASPAVAAQAATVAKEGALERTQGPSSGCFSSAGMGSESGDADGSGLLAGGASEQSGDPNIGHWWPEEEARGGERPPPAPRLRCDSDFPTEAAAEAVMAPAPAVNIHQAGGSDCSAPGAPSLNQAPVSTPTAGRGEGEDVDLAGIDVAEQRRILQLIQSQAQRNAASRTPRMAGTASQGGAKSRGGKSGKRPGGGSGSGSEGAGGMHQPSLKRFFSRSQGSSI